jgi:hypothetical protein
VTEGGLCWGGDVKVEGRSLLMVYSC